MKLTSATSPRKTLSRLSAESDKPVRGLLAIVLALAFIVLPVWSSEPAAAQDASLGSRTLPAAAGTVELPRETYDQLVNAARDPKLSPRPAPVPWALGQAAVKVTVSASGSARVNVTLQLRVLEDGWNLVPVLPSGTSVDSASVGGTQVQLAGGADGLAWGVRKAGRYQMNLSYRVDVQTSEGGEVLTLPLPQASAISLEAVLPDTGIDVAVVPSAGLEITSASNQTKVSATIPSTRGVMMSWSRPTRRGHVLSRAIYTGRLEGGAMRFEGTYDVELFGDAAITLPLLPRSVTLSRLLVDGKETPILVEGNRFATLVRGRGRHKVIAGFEVAVQHSDGPPAVNLNVPLVPVSRLELILPGKKDMAVTPASSVDLQQVGETTVARAHLPMTDALRISWTEAVPEDVRAELRAHAATFHAAHAEEGVLFMRALIDLEVTRGSTSSVRLRVPDDVQINEVKSPGGGVVDWRLDEEASRDGSRELAVFLDRQLSDQMRLEIRYDRSLPGDEEPLAVPLLSVIDAQRQRGMVAMLQSRELTLEPVGEGDVTRVGENQLPAFVRDALELTVAHTFKYVESPPALEVRALRPEREQGRFDALVDTLISLGEVTLEGTASVEVDVKSGLLTELRLELPPDTHLLGLSGPSVREHSVEQADGRQWIDVEFTQDMEGQFRLDVSYEQILASAADTVPVPTLRVEGAEVEQGRLAVEALSAVEVQPETAEQLTTLDVAELPRRLILRTTHPILHAYKYVGTSHRLDLRVTRHEVVDVQEAAIDQASYRTLFTRDGLAVTLARFQVRNSREQFLRVRLPADSKVWSVFVDGKSEKPALTEGEDGVWHLIRIIHSTQGFPVEMVYETPSAPIRGLGTVRGVLPRPHILVTQSRWDVWVPEGVEYRSPHGGLEPASSAPEDAETAARELAELGEAMEPLRLEVPKAGRRFSFQKLYANQGKGDVGFEIPYVTGFGRSLGRLGVFAGATALWFGLAALWRGRRRTGLGLVLIGGVLLLILLQRFAMGLAPLFWTSLLALVLLTFAALWRWRMSKLSWSE